MTKLVDLCQQIHNKLYSISAGNVSYTFKIFQKKTHKDRDIIEKLNSQIQQTHVPTFSYTHL
jgi:hypothetical protein